MNGKKRMIAFILLVLIMIAGGAQAQTLSVAPSEGDYPDLQQAIDAASPCDEITVAAGIYPGGVIISVPVTLSGVDGATIGTPSDTVALYVNANGVAIKNLACTASGAGIIANQTDGFQADGCQIISDDSGILLTGCEGSAITNTQINAQRTGIGISSCTGTTITNSRITADSLGLSIQDSADTTVTGTHIFGTEVGILAENTAECTVTDTTFAGVGGAVLGIGINESTITGPVFSDVTQFIQFYAASGCRVEAPSLQGPAFFAADIFSDTEYRFDTYTVTGQDIGLIYEPYEVPEGYLLFGDAMNISFIAAAKSTKNPFATITADYSPDTIGIAENTYAIYRIDGDEPVLVAVPKIADNGTQILQATVTEPGHFALMARAEEEKTPYYYIYLWGIVALGVLLLLVLWRKR